MPASRVIRLVLLASTLVIGLDVLITGHLSLVFGLCFPLICLGAALAIRPAHFFQVGVLPPLLMLGLVGLLTAIHRPAITSTPISFTQDLINGLADHAVALLVGYALCLGVLAIRHHFLQRSHPPAHAGPRPAPQANLSGSPAPMRTTSGAPEEKSTTVVGNEPHSPESSTASTW